MSETNENLDSYVEEVDPELLERVKHIYDASLDIVEHYLSRFPEAEFLKQQQEKGRVAYRALNASEKKQWNRDKQKRTKAKLTNFMKVRQVHIKKNTHDEVGKLAVGLAYVRFLEANKDHLAASSKGILPELNSALNHDIDVLFGNNAEKLVNLLKEVSKRNDALYFLAELASAENDKNTAINLEKLQSRINEMQLTEGARKKRLEDHKRRIQSYTTTRNPALKEPLSNEDLFLLQKKVEGTAFRIFTQEDVDLMKLQDPLAYAHFLEIMSLGDPDDVAGYMLSIDPGQAGSLYNLMIMLEKGGCYVNGVQDVILFDKQIHIAFMEKLKTASGYIVERHIKKGLSPQSYTAAEIRLIQLFFNVSLALEKKESLGGFSPLLSGTNYIAMDGKMGKEDLAKYETNRIVYTLELKKSYYPGLRNILHKIPDREKRRDVVLSFCREYFKGRDYYTAFEKANSSLGSDQKIQEVPPFVEIVRSYGPYLAFLIHETLEPGGGVTYPIPLPGLHAYTQITIPFSMLLESQQKKVQTLTGNIKNTYLATRQRVLVNQLESMNKQIKTLSEEFSAQEADFRDVMEKYGVLIEKLGTQSSSYAEILTLASDLFVKTGNYVTGKSKDTSTEKYNTIYSSVFTQQAQLLQELQVLEIKQKEIQEKVFSMLLEQFQVAGELGGKEAEVIKKELLMSIITGVGFDFVQRDVQLLRYARAVYPQLGGTEQELVGIAIGEKNRTSVLSQSTPEQEKRDIYGLHHEDVRQGQHLSVVGSGTDKKVTDDIFGINKSPPNVESLHLCAVQFDTQTIYMDLSEIVVYGIGKITDLKQLIPQEYTNVKIALQNYDDPGLKSSSSRKGFPYQKTVYRPRLSDLILTAEKDGAIVSFPLTKQLFQKPLNRGLPLGATPVLKVNSQFYDYRVGSQENQVASLQQVNSFYQQEEKKVAGLNNDPIILQLRHIGEKMQVHYAPFFKLLEGDATATEDIKNDILNLRIPELLNFNHEMVTFLGSPKVKDHLQGLDVNKVLESMGIYNDALEKQVKSILVNTNHIIKFFGPNGGAETILKELQNKKNLETRLDSLMDELKVLSVVILVSVSVMLVTGGVGGIVLGAVGGLANQEVMTRYLNMTYANDAYVPYMVGDRTFTTTYKADTPLTLWEEGKIDTKTMLAQYGVQLLKQIALQLAAVGFGKYIGGPFFSKIKASLTPTNSVTKLFTFLDDIAKVGPPGQHSIIGRFISEYLEEVTEETVLEKVAGEIHPICEYLLMMFSASKGGTQIANLGPDIGTERGVTIDKVTVEDKKVKQVICYVDVVHFSGDVDKTFFDLIPAKIRTDFVIRPVDGKSFSTGVVMQHSEKGYQLVFLPSTIPGTLREAIGSFSKYVETTEEEGKFNVKGRADVIKNSLKMRGYVITSLTDTIFTAEDLYGNNFQFEVELSRLEALLRTIESQGIQKLERIRTKPERSRSNEERMMVMDLREQIMGLSDANNDVRLEVATLLLDRDDGVLSPEACEAILEAHQIPTNFGTMRRLVESGLFEHEEIRRLTFLGVCGGIDIYRPSDGVSYALFNTYFSNVVSEVEFSANEKFNGLRDTVPAHIFKAFMDAMGVGGVDYRVFQSDMFRYLLNYVDSEKLTEFVREEKYQYTSKNYDSEEALWNSRELNIRDIDRQLPSELPDLVNVVMKHSFYIEDIKFAKCDQLPSSMEASLSKKGGCILYNDQGLCYSKIDEAIPTSLFLYNNSWSFGGNTDEVNRILLSLKFYLNKRFGRADISALSAEQKSAIYLQSLTEFNQEMFSGIKSIGFNTHGVLTVELSDAVLLGNRRLYDADDVMLTRPEKGSDTEAETYTSMLTKASATLGTEKQDLELIDDDILWVQAMMKTIKKTIGFNKVSERERKYPPYSKMIHIIRDKLNDEQRKKIADLILDKQEGSLSQDQYDAILVVHVNSANKTDKQKYRDLRTYFSEDETKLLMRWGVCGQGAIELEMKEMRGNKKFQDILYDLKSNRLLSNHTLYLEKFMKNNIGLALGMVKKFNEDFDLSMWRIYHYFQDMDGSNTYLNDVSSQVGLDGSIIKSEREVKAENVMKELNYSGSIDTYESGGSMYDIVMNFHGGPIQHDGELSVSLVDTHGNAPNELAAVSFVIGENGMVDVVQIQSAKGVQNKLPQGWNTFLVEKIKSIALSQGFAGVRILKGSKNYWYMFPTNVDETFDLETHQTIMTQNYEANFRSRGLTEKDDWYSIYKFEKNSNSDFNKFVETKEQQYGKRFEALQGLVTKARASEKQEFFPYTLEKITKFRTEIINFTHNATSKGIGKDNLEGLVKNIDSFTMDNSIKIQILAFLWENKIADPTIIKLYKEIPSLRHYAGTKDFPIPQNMKPTMFEGKGQNGYVFCFTEGEIIKIPNEGLAELFKREGMIQDSAYATLEKGKKAGLVSARIHIPKVLPHAFKEGFPYMKMEYVYGYSLSLHENAFGTTLDLQNYAPRPKNRTERTILSSTNLSRILDAYSKKSEDIYTLYGKYDDDMMLDLESKLKGITAWQTKLLPYITTKKAFLNLYVLSKHDPKYENLYDEFVTACKYLLMVRPGIIHNNISSDNIMLQYNQKTGKYDLYLIDFGLGQILPNE